MRQRASLANVSSGWATLNPIPLLTNYNQVRSSCSYGFKVPAPLSDAKQASYDKNVEAAGLNMLRKAMGAAMTLKFD